MEKFEEGFLLGASTSAHQVEGSNINSDYWVMEHLKHTSFEEPSGDAVGHYYHFEEDIRLLAKAGANAYRFSVEWARIEPEKGRFDQEETQHYRSVLQCCHKYGLTPIVTLHHFTSPRWVARKGGWNNKNIVTDFAQYAEYIAEELGALVPYFCTINEANMGYQIYRALTAPARQGRSPEDDVQVGVRLNTKQILLQILEQSIAFRSLPFQASSFLHPRSWKKELIVLEAHRSACEKIRQKSPNSKVGLTMTLHDFQSIAGGEQKARELWENEFLKYLPYIREDDFLGVQNYSRQMVDEKGMRQPDKGMRLTQMGYEDYPASVGHVLLQVAKVYPGELIVTENGLVTLDDERRCEFICEALKGVQEAMERGVKLRGYCYWSLLDNFEWQSGFEPKYGLIAVDRKTQKRYPKKSLSVLGAYAEKLFEEANDTIEKKC